MRKSSDAWRQGIEVELFAEGAFPEVLRRTQVQQDKLSVAHHS
jgi:hypothetical protein